MSIGLQYGVPLSVLSKKFVGMRLSQAEDGKQGHSVGRKASSTHLSYLSIKYLTRTTEVMGLGEYAAGN